MAVFLWLSCVAALLLATVAPRLAAIGLCFAALRALRVQPRKTIDISWRHLLAGLRSILRPSSESQESLEAAIGKIWSPKRGDAMVFLSVRTGMDAYFAALDLPKGSEVLFWPGITIPSVVQIVEDHGLRARGAEPSANRDTIAVEDLESNVTPDTKVLVIMHLFGSVVDHTEVIKAAKARGLYVIEDVAQGFVGVAPSSTDSKLYMGFKGHEGVDAAFVSFGTMKTLTALGGAVGHVQDADVRRRMQEMQASYPVRPVSQYRKALFKAFLYKVFLRPSLWGLISAFCACFRIDLDKFIIGAVRGFPEKESIKQRCSLPLLQMIRRRLEKNHEACLTGSRLTYSSVTARKAVADRMVARLREANIEVLPYSTGGVDSTHTWWLMPILDQDPKRLVRKLWKCGFDATCSSTQLASVNSGSSSMLADTMSKVVYLPLSPEMSFAAADSMVATVISSQQQHSSFDIDAQEIGKSSRNTKQTVTDALPSKAGSRFALGVLLAGLATTLRPSLFSLLLWLLPTMRCAWWLSIALIVAVAVFLIVGRRLAAAPELEIDSDFLASLKPKQRLEGVDYIRSRKLAHDARIDGAIFLTGATGFVGGATLFHFLARAEELGISRIVVLIRRKAGSTVQERLAKLRETDAFSEVKDLFDALVVPLEGDIAQPGWLDQQERKWPYEEPLRAVVHCAADVRFDQPLQQAAVSSISASLQATQLASQWGAGKFVYVSTAFVHAVPSAGKALEERLVELRDFHPNELYKDIVADGSWAQKAMRELGFPNTYTFTKAVAEHLVTRACASAKVDARIVRPSIVTPAWGAPFAGYSGAKVSGSPIVAAVALLHRRAARVFACSEHPIPLVPVDMVAESIVRALITPRSNPDALILHATVDTAEANTVPSFYGFFKHSLRLGALTGETSLAEAGLTMYLHRRVHVSQSLSTFWFFHAVFNVFPSMLFSAGLVVAERVATWLPGYASDDWKYLRSGANLLRTYRDIPAQYVPFSSPKSPWLFSSSCRLPKDWDSAEYFTMLVRIAVSHSRPKHARDPKEVLTQVSVNPTRPAWLDFLLIFSTPRASIPLCTAAFIVRRVLLWMDLVVAVDAVSLASVTRIAMPLVLCPTHRSVLDFVIISVACFHLHPIVPKMHLPHVAADAEFSGLPILGRALKALGAFFVRRGGGGVQPDPALRAEVARVFRHGRPIEVFLEGLRSRGRRHLRLRTGFLRALRDVAQRNVALVPLALSYECLPEDEGFYDELQGLPRAPLQTIGLIRWVLRCARGELPSYGLVQVRLGSAQVLDNDSNLHELLSEVQEQLVDLTSLTTLHTTALADIIDLPADAVISAFQESGFKLQHSSIVDGRQLAEAEKWPLALQAATALRKKLPSKWSAWLVEPVTQIAPAAVDVGDELGAACAENELDFDMLGEAQDDSSISRHSSASDTAEALEKVIDALSSLLRDAENTARSEAASLRDSGLLQLTEDHLFQQLLKSNKSHSCLPPPLAHGAARIVAASLKSSGLNGNDVIDGSREAPPVMPLWPTSHSTPEKRSDEAALDRWGFKDTKFVAQWVDGRPAIQITSNRYGALAKRPMHGLWSFLERELQIKMGVRDTLPERALPELPAPAESVKRLVSLLPEAHVHTDVASRIRAGTGHGLADIWRLRAGELLRMPDAVIRPESEEEVLKVLQVASEENFAVIPVGGRTNVTSALVCPAKEVDPRPFIALDMKGLAKVRWVKKEDGVAMIEAGITGMALKEALREEGVNMGMEPDSMEFSTLGGWIATRASGMKRARYGNIEDMVVEVRVVTPSGILWQHHGETKSTGESSSAFGRVSTNSWLPGLMLGSEGCLGVVVAAVVRVRPLPEVVEYESIVFPCWEQGASFMQSVAKQPAALRPASCRLMDKKQLQLASTLKEDPSKGYLRKAVQQAYLQLRGVALENAAAATLVFEGSQDEVWIQKRSLKRLLKGSGGLWGGASSGEAGYALTFAIAYLRDIALDYQILSESLETMAPWSAIHNVWPAVVAAVEAEHSKLRLPGKPFLSCRMTQLYDEGGVLYMYLAICTRGLSAGKALEAFHGLEVAARKAVLKEGGCLSHHHGIGKHRAAMLATTQAPATTNAMRGLKTAMDPKNILGACNGPWNHDEIDALPSVESPT